MLVLAPAAPPLHTQAFRDNKDSIRSQFNLPALRQLFETVDVVGISHYAPMPLQMTFASFEVRTVQCPLSHSVYTAAGPA